jgi:hypothetical protein
MQETNASISILLAVVALTLLAGIVVAAWLFVGPSKILSTLGERKRSYQRYMDQHPDARRQVRLANIAGIIGIISLFTGMMLLPRGEFELGAVLVGVGTLLLLSRMVLLSRYDHARLGSDDDDESK